MSDTVVNHNLVIGHLNQFLSGSVSASASVAGLGPSQLQNDQGNASFALQIPGTSGSITVSGSAEYRMFGLFRTNLTPSASVSWSIGGASCAVVPWFGQSVLVLDAPVSAGGVTVSISDPSNPDGFLNIPLAYAGPGFQPLVNMDFSSAPNRQAGTLKEITRAGGTLARNDWVKRTFDLSMSNIRPDEVTTMDDIDLVGRHSHNILFVPDPMSATIGREAIFGEWEGTSGLTYPYQAADARGYRATITERL
jgi:hypothetical protein